MLVAGWGPRGSDPFPTQDQLYSTLPVIALNKTHPAGTGLCGKLSV